MIGRVQSIRRTVFLMALSAIVLMAFTVLPSPLAGHAQGTYASATFTDLTFSISGDGPGLTYFPLGTQQIFARWNYYNVPSGQGITLLRQWYVNGVLSIQKQDPWNAAWGATGYLKSISIFDFHQGLTPGNYHVVISLMYDYPAAQVTGDFVIAGYPATSIPSSSAPAFGNLTVSTSASGPNMQTFPANTPTVSARWDYANIPIGTMMRRDWYLNGELFRTVQEPWSAYWGASGRLTHIALYDYQNGLAAGNYRLTVSLRDMPAVQVTIFFTIGARTTTAGPFNNLTFSTSGTGAASAIFPRGTPEVFARWDFHNVSIESILIRRWFRNGVMWLERRQGWLYGPNGTVQNVSIFDYQYGLLPGDYRVEISLDGVPSSLIVGYFTIQ